MRGDSEGTPSANGETPLNELIKRPLVLSVAGALVVGVGSWLIFGGLGWLPIPMAVLTVGLLAECVRTDRPTLSARLSIATGAMVVGLLAVVTMTSDDLLGKPSVDQNTVEVALAPSATTTPEVAVEGASLNREDYERLSACETALAAIADAISAAPGFESTDAGYAASVDDTAEYRLRSCEVRLNAISLSLQP